MAESTLTAAYNDLTGDVGFFLGYGRGAANGDVAWTTGPNSQQTAIDRCVRGGLRGFYYAGPNWSFLHPTANLLLASGSNVSPLPDDFGGIEDEITIQTTGSLTWWPIPLMGEGNVRAQFAVYPATTGRPMMAAVQPLKGTTGTQSNRCQLYVFPTADAAYTLTFQYYVNPDYLSGAFPYAYGGPEHAETLLESCLAVAEKILDDEATVHAQAFAERLAVSTLLDQRKKPQTLGYNHDRSDLRDRRAWPWRSHVGAGITYKGTQY